MPAYEHPDGVLASNQREVDELTQQGWDKCRNQNCLFMVSPQTIDELSREYGQKSIPYRCPHCGLSYDLAKTPGRPGGTTNAGIGMDEQAQIGEDLVEHLGGLPGYGPFLWFHSGGWSGKSAFDAAVKGWGVEIKTVNWTNTPKGRRGIIDPQERLSKLRAVQNPKIWAKEMNDPTLDAAIHAIGHVQGLLGVLVLLDFDTGLADIFMRPMPHDPEHRSGGIIHFGLYNAIPVAEKIPFKSSLPDTRAEGFVPFHQQSEFAEEPHPFAAKTALDYAGDAYPAEEPQAAQDIASQYPPERSTLPSEREYKFFYGNGQLHVSPVHEHRELAQHAQVPDDHTGPMAVGYVTVMDDYANWDVKTNVAVHAFSRILKDYTEQVGWKWGGLSDLEGEPVGTGSEYAGKRSMWYAYDDNDEWPHLYMGHDIHRIISKGDYIGKVNIVGKTASLARQNRWAPEFVKEALAEWATDFGYHFADYPGGSNMNDLIKNQQDIGGEDLELHNIYTPNPNPRTMEDDREPSGLFRCPECKRLFAGWHTYMLHRQQEEPPGDEPVEDGKFPEIDTEALPQGHFHEREPQVDPISTPNIARTAVKDPKDLVKSSVPFIYDIQEDKIITGEPGQKHSDIHGAFTPGGIVEGTYEPGGKVIFRSVTNMPYSVYHVIDLWYYQHPEFEVTGLAQQDDAGNVTKLASREGWFAPSFHVPQNARDQIHQWVQNQQWPEGTVLNDPSKYHITGVYSGEGYQDPENHNWVAQQANVQHPATVSGLDAFTASPGKNGFPIVLRIASPSLQAHGERLHEEAKQRGLPVSEFEGGYKPHLTIGYASEHPGFQPPPFQFPAGPLFELHNHYDSQKQSKLANENIGEYLRTLALTDPAVYSAYQALKDAGGRIYVVGGAVRDALLQKEPKDIDLMVQGVPSEAVRHALSALPGRVDLTGKDFGVYRYKTKGHEVEIALPRRERSTGVGHQDFDVSADHNMPVTEDLLRRDFTANAMAVDLDTGQLIDPFGGAQDIEQGNLRTVSPKSLEEDPLRTVRALVASSKHGLTPTEETRTQMAQNADGLLHLPTERIQAELDKLFESKDPAKAIRLAHDTGVLKHILPEVEEAWDFDQHNPHHKLPLGEHLIHVLHNATQHTDDPDVRLAALLHDIGKPASAWQDADTGSFHYYHDHATGQGADHELVGAEMAARRMRELHYPNSRIERVQGLITHHMYPDFSSVKGARKFLNRVGDHADDLFLLRHADRYGKGTDDFQDTKTPVPRQRELVQKVRDAGQATSQADLAINGNDLINIGLKPGRQFGAILAELTNEVVDDPTKNDQAYLLNRAMELA